MWLWEMTEEDLAEGEDAGIHATSLAFSPNGRWLATHGWDGQVDVWDPPHPEWISSVDDNGGSDHLVTFSPDGRWLAVAGQGVGFYEVGPDGELSPSDDYWPDNDKLTTGVAFTPDGRHVLVADTHCGMAAVGFYDLVFFEEKAGVVTDTEGASGPLALSSQGLIATGREAIRVWPMGTGRQRKLSKRAYQGARRLDHDGEIRALAFSPDGKVLAGAAHNDGYLWEVDTGKATRLAGHDDIVTSLAFHPQGRLLASASLDGTVRFWDVLARRLIRAYRWPLGKVKGVAFAPDGMRAAACGTSGKIALWDVDEEG
jgi:WD40 repeat protein